MAKKDAKKDSEEEYEFEVPDFDEDAFIHKEIVSFKTTSILFAWGVIAALASWLVYEFALEASKTGWYVGILIVAAFGYSLRWIYPALNIDISHFGRKEWLGTGFLVFFTWLAFFLVLVNPPFSDHAEPIIEVYASPELQQLGDDVRLDLFITDNGRVKEHSFQLLQGSTVIATEADLSRDTEFPGHYQYRFEAPGAGDYTYRVNATDGRGNTATHEGMFRVTSRAVTVTLPGDGSLDPGDRVLVILADPDIKPLNVYLRLEDGRRIYMSESPADGGYIATDRFVAYRSGEGGFERVTGPGWQTGANNFTVFIEQDNRFFGPEPIAGADITRGPFEIDVPGPVGSFDEVQPKGKRLVSPHARSTPDIGVPLLLVGLVAVAAVVRRRR